MYSKPVIVIPVTIAGRIRIDPLPHSKFSKPSPTLVPSHTLCEYWTDFVETPFSDGTYWKC